MVLGLGLVSFFTNVSKAQESTIAKIDESQMYVKMTDNLPIKGKKIQFIWEIACCNKDMACIQTV